MLRNFRCFAKLDLEFHQPVVLIHGPNGSGKTSILEALHYACYLRSFKTHLPREIATSGTGGFGVVLGIASEGYDTLHVMMQGNKKTLKLNDKAIGSYKELYDAYKVVTITQDDLQMIQGGPAVRRTFLDHMALLHNPEYVVIGKKYRIVLENRNALLAARRQDDESYQLWTDQLITYSRLIWQERQRMLELLKEASLSLMGALFLSDDSVSLSYEFARPYSEMESIHSTSDLLSRYPSIVGHEMAQKRSLFGAHLDDFSVLFQGKASRSYASRGQQKLLVFLLKLASIKCLTVTTSGVILLVDDFMTDFDAERAQSLVPLLTSLPSQLIVTSPVEAMVKDVLQSYTPQIIDLQVDIQINKNKTNGQEVTT